MFVYVSTQNSSNAKRNLLCTVHTVSEQKSRYFVVVVGVVFVFNVYILRVSIYYVYIRMGLPGVMILRRSVHLNLNVR